MNKPYHDLTVTQKNAIRDALVMFERKGIICSATAPLLVKHLDGDPEILEHINISLAPKMMAASKEFHGFYYYYHSIDPQVVKENADALLVRLTKELRFALSFTQIIHRIGDQTSPLTVGGRVTHHEALTLAIESPAAAEALDKCFGHLQGRKASNDIGYKLKSVFDKAQDIGLIVNDLTMHIVTGRLLYMQSLFAHIYEVQGLEIDDGSDLAILTQTELL